jgi:putative transposase
LVLHESHGGEPLFRDDEDLHRYRAILASAVRAHGLALHAYGMATQRIGLLATPQTAAGFSRGLQAIAGGYAAYFNRRHARSGTLWSGRFRATVIEPAEFLLTGMQYVETQLAVVAGQDGAGDVPGQLASSLERHIFGRADSLVDDHPLYWALGNTPFDREVAYRAFIEDRAGARKLLDVANGVRKGWALGGADFLQGLTDSAPRRVIALKPGRPPRKS